MVVYKVTNSVNGKVYIGKWMRARVEDRWKAHVHAASKGSKLYLSNAIRKYGPDAFRVEVIHQAKTKDELDAMETFFIVLHQSHKPENGYNMTLGGDGASPGKLNPRYGEKALHGAAHPMFGRHHSNESNQKNRKAHLGKKATAETRALLSKAHKGKKPTLETRQRISAAKLGKKVPKLSQALKGRVFSDKHKRNLSVAAKLRAQRPECFAILKANLKKAALQRQNRGSNAT
jgi:group I intron endonuclease